jgi:predicted molibdopterin-dependent oxidoreductase YjgC
MRSLERTPFSLKRLEVAASAPVEFLVDGRKVTARRGETLLTALNAHLGHVRNFEFLEERRSGFCWMGACQDCWLWTSSGERIRACTSLVETNVSLSTSAPKAEAGAGAGA